MTQYCQAPQKSLVEGIKMLRVLVVDDDTSSRVVIKTALEAKIPGVFVEHFGDGLETLEFMSKQEVDVVITDLDMPIMDGLELVEAIVGSEQHDASVIVVSGSSNDDRAVGKALQAGANGFIRKPFRVAELVAAVNEAATG